MRRASSVAVRKQRSVLTVFFRRSVYITATLDVGVALDECGRHVDPHSTSRKGS
jgi:hypothetical protein